MKLSVISPTLNEAGNVARLVDELGRALAGLDYEILIADDNSSDGTWSVAQEISQSDSRVRVLRRMENPGLSAAVIDGFAAADGEVVACIDADLQHDPAILSAMFAELTQGRDVVVGSRHVTGGSTGEWSGWRRFESWMATKTAQALLGFNLKDPMSGYFLMRRDDFLRVRRQLDGKGFKILLEILANLDGCGIKEVPYTFRPRTHGQSKLSGRIILQYIHQVWRLCSSSQHLFVRFMKSVVVGGTGVFINLLVMALLLRLTRLHNWTASAIASLAANFQNYVLHNIWKYADRVRTGLEIFAGYFSYLFASAPGLLVATASYAVLHWGLGHTAAMQRGTLNSIFCMRMLCQLAAVLLGVWTNGRLKKVFEPVEVVRPALETVEVSDNSALTEPAAAAQSGKPVSSFAAQAGK